MSGRNERQGPMSKTIEALHLRGIYNPHNLCSKFGGSVYVDYRPQENGRMATSAAYRVIGVRGQKFSTVWYHHGCRVFMVPYPTHGVTGSGGSDSLKERRATALSAALSFAGALVSDQPTRWGRDPFGAWQTMDVLGRAGVKAREAREVTPTSDLRCDNGVMPPLTKPPPSATRCRLNVTQWARDAAQSKLRGESMPVTPTDHRPERERYPDCPSCQNQAKSMYGPSHDGSPLCRDRQSIASGGQRAHCGCVACF